MQRLAERLVAGECWDVVFNICEGLKGVSREAQVPALLEAYDVPYVFSDPLTLSLALDKGMAKRVVRSAGVPTPDFAVIECDEDARGIDLPYPLFLKPVAEGSGKGVDAQIASDRSHGAAARGARICCARFQQPVLAETFLPGREFTVGITGTGPEASVLGVIEVIWTDKAAAHGYGYENKEHFEEKMHYRLAEDRAAEQAGRRGAGGAGAHCVAATAAASISVSATTATPISSRSIRWRGSIPIAPISFSSPASKAFPIAT